MDSENSWPNVPMADGEPFRVVADDEAASADNAAIAELNHALAIARAALRRCEHEYYAALRYHSPALASVALVHANEAKIHKDRIAARIAELGGASQGADSIPSASRPKPRASASIATLIDADVAADAAAIASLRDIDAFFAPRDPVTRELLDAVIAGCEERARNLAKLLESRPAA